MPAAGRLQVAGQELEYLALPGARAAPSLVLLHEGLGCVALWKDFPALLRDATGLPVFVYSRAGYGGSSPITLPRPLDFHTREALEMLPAVLDAAGLTDTVLIGHSDGATIALVYAGVTQDPRVRALVAMAPHVFCEAQTVLTIGAAKCAYQATDLRERLARRHGANIDNAFWGWCDAWLDAGFADWSVEQHLPGVAVPVLTVRGDDDPYSSAAHVERIARALPGRVERVALAGCGHSPQLDQPTATVSAIARFVSAVVGSVA